MKEQRVTSLRLAVKIRCEGRLAIQALRKTDEPYMVVDASVLVNRLFSRSCTLDRHLNTPRAFPRPSPLTLRRFRCPRRRTTCQPRGAWWRRAT